MNELSEYFGGLRTLGKIQSDESYKKWFSAMGEQINTLSFDNSTSVGRKINQLIKALEDIENYH